LNDDWEGSELIDSIFGPHPFGVRIKIIQIGRYRVAPRAL
jgi:hypothetical protein